MLNKTVNLLILMLVSRSALADITVSVDRERIVVDESFQLIFETNAAVKDEPDFSPLKKSFTILNSSRRSNTRIVNTDVTHTQQWILTVVAGKAGTLEIPSLQFGSQSSKPHSITILEKPPPSGHSPTDDIYLEAAVDNHSPYVQAQVIYTVKLYRAIQTGNETLSEPSVSGGQAVIHKLGEDTHFETDINGKRYLVVQRRYVIFPQASGPLTIEPLVFQAQTGRGGFFNFDPFGPQPKTIVKRSDAITLQVQPIPAAFTGDTWLPASNLSIEEQWSVNPGKLKQGEAATRTLILRATGLAASHLPPIEEALPALLKSYPDQPEFEESYDPSGLIGTRQDKTAIIAAEAGTYTLPAIRLAWWNTEKDKLEFAELPERAIDVAAVSTAANRADIEPPVTDAPGPAANIISPEPNTAASENIAATSPWKWISLALLVLWVVTVLIWWNSRGKKTKSAADISNLSEKNCLKKFHRACKTNDAQAAKAMLIQWANLKWPDQNMTSLGTIRNYCKNKLRFELDKLNRHLYGKTSGHWNGSGLLNSFKDADFDETGETEPVGRLEPLYKT